jgi:ATP-dependent Lon protease
VREYLGRRRYHYEDIATRTSVPGVATGMVVTSVGGDLTFIEATKVPGKGQLIITGQLGDVMKESAQAALSYVRARAEALGIEPDFLKESDIHIHVPAGAVPKDGPSAGVPIALALLSALSARPVRSDLAMTGEITLRGRVLSIGGVKEKVLGAHRAGITQILLPLDNEADLEDLADEVRRELTFHFVETLDEAIAIALLPAQEDGRELPKVA